jgi:NADH-quinone oxidoreductase subunit J
MIGAIVLTHRKRGDTRTPKVWRQNRRDPAEAVKLANPGVGEGMEL